MFPILPRWSLKNQQAMDIFDHAHPKITESNFSCPECVPASKKSVYSTGSFLR